MLHPLAQPLNKGQGGLLHYDHKGELLKGIKDVVGKVTSAALRGEIQEIFRCPTPAFFHSKAS